MPVPYRIPPAWPPRAAIIGPVRPPHAVLITIYWNLAWPVRLPLPISPCVNASANPFGGFGVTMNDYRWTLRVAVGGVGLLALVAVVALALRILGVVVAGVQPEAWVLTAMMTAPLTVGTVSVLTIGTALVETFLRRRRTTSTRA